VLIGVSLIVLKVIAHGFLPYDDALRHAAKAVSGKGWDEILVLRDAHMVDNHPGWHAILGVVHDFTGWAPAGLVVFSVFILFVLFTFIPVFGLERPEAWPAAFLIFAVTDVWLIERLLFGRPYIFSMAVVLLLSLMWPSMRSKKTGLLPAMALIAILVALATWIHGSWYLFALPVAAYFAAREWRIGRALALSVACGVIGGALLTGHPYLFLKQNLVHLVLSLGDNTPTRLLVGEFQPFNGDGLTAAAVIGMMGWRAVRGRWNRNVLDNPVFILALSGWVLGFAVRRFWFDWGMPALAVWIAWEFEDVFRTSMRRYSVRRIVLAVALVSVLYLAVTNDAGGRWTHNLDTEYLSQDDPSQAEWLPGPGGIVYSDSMVIFYDTFFKNPRAPWRYILGFEAALMPAEDLAVFRKIQWNYGAYQSFEPWVRKMAPEDRLILRRPSGEEPKIPGLEWHYAASDIWIGRTPHREP